MEIKYKLSLTVEDQNKSKCKVFSKTIKRSDLNLKENEPLLLDNSIISSYFDTTIEKYCKDKSISLKDLSVKSYKIESKTENVNVYIDSKDLARYSSTPSIYAVYEPTINSITLYGEQISKNEIRWSWEKLNDEVILLDENDNIIDRISSDVNYYIESDLNQNKTYTRKLVYNNIVSQETTVALNSNKLSYIYDNYKDDERDESLIERDNTYSSRLKAFSSGVGDGLDCKIFKPDDIKYGKNFSLLNKVYGVRASNVERLHTIKFDYRYKMVGVVDYHTYDGSATVSLSATPINNENQVIGQAIISNIPLKYKLDSNTQVANICFNDLITTLDKTKATRYKFSVNITDLNGNLIIYSRTNGYVKNKYKNGSLSFNEYGYSDSMITIASSVTIVQKEYIEYYPSLHLNPLTAVVNGEFEVSENGKRDYSERMYTFSTDDYVYDKKYYCVIEKVSPSLAYVKTSFKNEVNDNNYTSTNGDIITFSSNAIIEDGQEYSDFITQVERGNFFIDDNKKHIYNYKIKDIAVDMSKYKRLELEITADSNDINVLEHTVPINIINGKIDTDVSVAVRAISNSIAKWEVLIHNGYYYYNNEERFLYNKCMVNNENMILDEVYSKYDIAAKMSVEVSSPRSEIVNYDITKSSRDDLLLNESLFLWKENKVWPRPISTNDRYHEFLDEYIYDTEPFMFENKITDILSISWDENCNSGATIKPYLMCYNQVYGTWEEPISITNKSAVTDFKSSKIIKLRFIMNVNKAPSISEDRVLFSSKSMWDSSKESFLCNNLYYSKSYLQPKSIKSDAIYISKVYDLGDTVAIENQRAILFNLSHSGNVKIYIQEADIKSELEDKLDNSKWDEIYIGDLKSNLKRFFKFKLLLKANSKISYMEMVLNRYQFDEDYKSYSPGIGNIRFIGKHNPFISSDLYEQVFSSELIFNNKEYIFMNDSYDYLYQMSMSRNFDINKITKISIIPYGEKSNDFTLKYDEKSLRNTTVYMQSKSIEYNTKLIEKNQNGVVFEVSNNLLEVYPIPKQYAPVIIYEENEFYNQFLSNDIEPLTNVFFEDDDGGFSIYNVEEFESLGFKTLYLQYTDIDDHSVIATINNVEVDNFLISDNVIIFDNNIPKGSIVKVKYKLKNSYCVNYDYENDKTIIEFNKSGTLNIEKVRVFYETAEESSTRKLDNINLNPIYNTCYNGYIYICDYSLDPSHIYIYPSSDFIYANGKDEMNVLIKITDKYDNPIENVGANVVCGAGSISKLNELTDSNGIIHCIYKSANINCIDTIKAIATDTVKSSTIITNRKI